MKNICELSPLQILMTLIIVFKVICRHIKTQSHHLLNIKYLKVMQIKKDRINGEIR
jgi:hypothetical protein